MFHWMRFGYAATLVVVLAGCFSKSPTDWGGLFDKPTDEGKQLRGRTKLDVVARNLGNSQEVSLEPPTLAGRIGQLLKEKKPALAATWVRRHPDASLELLRALDEKMPADVLRLAAEQHDRQTLAAGRPGWTDVVRSWQTGAEPMKNYATRRHLFHERIADGLTDRALDLDLVGAADAAGSAVLSIDARQLHGTALMLAERPAEAAAVLADAIGIAADVSPYQAAYLLLLQSDAQRRAGDGPGAMQTWQQAVLAATRLCDVEPPVLDPVLWERLSYLRPVSAPWPADVIGRLATREPLAGLASVGGGAATASDEGADPARSETVVWHSIGRWYLDRGHAQAALVSFKRAESAATADETRHWLRFRQAKALTVLGQTGPATAILLGLVVRKPPAIEAPASALLGSLYVHRGQTQRGLQLLKKAVDRNDGVTWKERTEAEADLGLAHLTLGDAVVGLDYLHRAQEAFELEGELESLAAALENELRFLEHTGARKEAGAVRARLGELQKDA
jgi:tetratricopeptide (TPR) repeat protein